MVFTRSVTYHTSFHTHTMQDIPLVRFVPEIVVIGTESTTGLLTRGFTVYYGTGLSSSELHANFYGRPLGVVSVQAAIETLPVSHDQ